MRYIWFWCQLAVYLFALIGAIVVIAAVASLSYEDAKAILSWAAAETVVQLMILVAAVWTAAKAEKQAHQGQKWQEKESAKISNAELIASLFELQSAAQVGHEAIQVEELSRRFAVDGLIEIFKIITRTMTDVDKADGRFQRAVELSRHLPETGHIRGAFGSRLRRFSNLTADNVILIKYAIELAHLNGPGNYINDIVKHVVRSQHLGIIGVLNEITAMISIASDAIERSRRST